MTLPLTPITLEALSMVGQSSSTLTALGQRVFNVVAYKPTGTVSVDQPMLQQALADTPTGGILSLPSGGDTPYAIDTAFVVEKNVTIEGAGASEVGFDGDATTASPFLSGSVLMQTTAGANGIEVRGTGTHVDLRNFGVRFAPAIMFTNTGHGILSRAAATHNTGHDFGLMNSTWRGLKVFGHDGNHYGFVHTNALLNTYVDLRSYGGGGHLFETDSNVGICGNATLVHPYVALFVAGSAHGYAFSAIAGPGGGVGGLNLFTFVRPQVNVLDFSGSTVLGNPPVPTVSQYMWQAAASGGLEASAVGLIDPDLEANAGSPRVQSPVNFGTPPHTLVRNGGTINMGGGAAPTFASNASGYTRTPTMTGGAGAGTTPDLTVGAIVGSGIVSDRGGLLSIRPGTSPGARLTDVVTVTFAQLTKPLSVQLTPYNDGAAQLQWFVSAVTNTSFTIRCETALTPAALYQLSYSVVPAYD